MKTTADWARSSQIGGYELLLVANGVGATRAAAGVDAAANFHPDALISLGFCGALHPRLQVGDIVMGTAVRAGATTFETREAATVCRHLAGVVCSLDHVARTAEEKGRLYAAGAVAVEMEAAGVAARAMNLNLPFFCMKAVTDLADETLANDFNAALRSDGHFDTMKVLKSALRHPMVRVPETAPVKRAVCAGRADFGGFCCRLPILT